MVHAVEGEVEANENRRCSGSMELPYQRRKAVMSQSSWLPALWLGEGQSFRLKLVKIYFNSDHCNFSGSMFKSPRTMSDKPSSGKQPRRVSIKVAEEN